MDRTRVIELLVFLLKKMPPLVNKTRRPSFASHNALKIQLHANLLTAVFSCCKYTYICFIFSNSHPCLLTFYHACTVRGVDAALVSQTDHSGDHLPSLPTMIKALCEQIYSLMDPEYSAEQETEGVIQAGFELCEEVLHFTYNDGNSHSLQGY